MKYDVGLKEALSRTLNRLTQFDPVVPPVEKTQGLAVAEDCIVSVDCPSARVSLKDGYAVIAAEMLFFIMLGWGLVRQ